MRLKERMHKEKLRKLARLSAGKYPLATLAYYGPDDQFASKLVVGIVSQLGGEVDPMKRWYADGTDARVDPGIKVQVLAFLAENNVKATHVIDRIFGCPHEEGIDYPEGEPCPQCPFWANRDRYTGKLMS